MPSKIEAPSSKVVTGFVVSVLGLIVLAVADDRALLAELPDSIEPVVVALLAALAAYVRKERRPSSSAVTALRHPAGGGGGN
jgi:hypothetical protein